MTPGDPTLRRSLELKALIAGLLVFSGLGWLRLQQAFAAWDFLLELGLWPGPLYMAAGGALWGLCGLAGGLALWLRRRWAPRLALAAALLITASYWIDRLVFARSAAAQVNLPFAAGATLIGLGFVILTLTLPRQRRYFADE